MNREETTARRAGALCILALALFPAAAFAAHPLGVEDAGTEGKGKFLLEFTGAHVRQNSAASDAVAAALTGGIAKHIDLQVESPYLFLRPGPQTGRNESGPGDATIKLKHRVLERPDKNALAYIIHTELPAGDDERGLGSGRVGWGALLVGTRRWEQLKIHVNLGYDSHGSALKNADFTLAYAVAFGIAAEYETTEHYIFVAEFSGERRTEGGARVLPLFLLGGVIYEFSEAWSVDAGVRAGLNDDAEDYALLAGAAMKF